MIMEGTVSQIFYLGPSLSVFISKNDFYKIYKMFPDFCHKISTSA